MLATIAKWGGIAAGGLLGLNMLGKAFGTDVDFMQAYMLNRMTGQGGFFKTYFSDGLRSLFMGSRTASAMFGSGGMMGMPFGSAMYGGMMGMNPYMANPMMMGSMAYPMGMGRMMWGV